MRGMRRQGRLGMASAALGSGGEARWTCYQPHHVVGWNLAEAAGSLHAVARLWSRVTPLETDNPQCLTSVCKKLLTNE